MEINAINSQKNQPVMDKTASDQVTKVLATITLVSILLAACSANQPGGPYTYTPPAHPKTQLQQ